MQRLRSIDILRGAVMVMMAIDHVRLYGGVPAGGSSADLFFTRWVTHFSAPGFTFLAGVSIFFNALKLNNPSKISQYLIIRGLLLVILEITIIRFFWAFHVDYSQFFLAGVIWMLGWCMVLMALLVRLKPLGVGIIGLIIIFAQQLFHFMPQLFPLPFQTSFGKFWNFVYPTGIEMPDNIAILYVIVPWIGIMAVGYGFGLVMQMEEKKRRKICLFTGLGLIILFALVGSIMISQNHDEKNSFPFILQLLNQRKYPASPLFLAMTLGPIIALIPYAEKVRGWLADVLIVFGKTPFFYYLIHVLLIHLSALAVNFLRSRNMHQDWYNIAPFYTEQPEGIRWSLPLLYAVWLVDVMILFLLCRWYAKQKEQHPNSWVKFI